MHGEMPKDFNPRVWWVSLGMNDLGRSQCSEEVVVIGILRVVEQIRLEKPDALIVINSLLPMADLRGGLFPLVTDYKDAFRQGRGHKAVPVDSSRYVPKSQITPSETNQEVATGKIVKKPKGNTREVDRPKKQGKGGNDSSRRLAENNGRSLGRRHQKGEKKQEEKKQEEKKQEEMDATELRRQKRLEFHQRMRRDPVNPRLNPYQHKMRKYDAHKLFLQKNRLPLWTSINAINEELKKFCAKHQKITFFDSTEIFAERAEGGQYVLLSDLISVRGHPTVMGFEKWEDAIVERLKKLLPKIKKDQPTKAQQPPDKPEQLNNIRKVTKPPKKEDDNEKEDEKKDNDGNNKKDNEKKDEEDESGNDE
jgi:hypothetical protein